MAHILQNHPLTLTLDLGRADFSLASTDGGRIEGLQTSLTYSLAGATIQHHPESWQLVRQEQSSSLVEAQVAWQSPGNVRSQLFFQLHGGASPLLCWQMQITNEGHHPITVNALAMFNCGQDGRPWFTPGFRDPFFHVNGWQSWSYAGTYQAHETARRTRLGPLSRPMLYDPADPRLKRKAVPGQFTSDMFGIIGCRQNRLGILAGFLSQRQHFGFLDCRFDPLSFTTRKNAREFALAPVLRLVAAGDDVVLAPGDQMTSDWACLQFVSLDADRPIEPYLRKAAEIHGLDDHGRRNSLPAHLSLPDNGWCSWYYFYQNITAQNLQNNLEMAARLQPDLHLDLFQIDDGFETRVGDWFEFRPGFPNGVAPLAAEIRQAGFMPGLWLAPFILQPSSKIARAHPDWLLRDKNQRPVNAGFVWNNLTNALDIAHPEALAYAAESVRAAVHDWGFKFLKLDFLYTGALAGYSPQPTKTRAQILRRALETLREAAGDDTIILGCGCPLGSAIGLIDVMRIGPDVDQRWEPSFAPLYKLSRKANRAIFHPETNMPSARNAIHNVLARLPLHQRWWINDPDCLILRESSELTLAEVQSLATAIFLSAGQVLLSDDLPALTPERLRIAKTMFPRLPEAAYARDWFENSPPQHLELNLTGPSGKWKIVALFNWEETIATRLLQPGSDQDSGNPGLWCAHDFWRKETIFLDEQTKLDIPPHGVRLLSVRQVSPERPAYLGSDLHMSQGLEVANWDVLPDGSLQISFKTSNPLTGLATLYLPWPDDLRITGQDGQSALPFKRIGQHLIQFMVTCERFEKVTILPVR